MIASYETSLQGRPIITIFLGAGAYGLYVCNEIDFYDIYYIPIKAQLTRR